MSEQWALVGDIGGTNARFALVHPGATVLQQVQVLPCRDFDNLDGAVREYLSRCGVSGVAEACMAFACPVHHDRIKMTNNHWDFSRSAMQETLGLSVFKCVNDFTAMALGVPHIAGEQLLQVGGGIVPEQARARLVIGPGTGLGVSGLIRTSRHWVPLSTEGGHVSYAPTSEQDIAVLRVLMRRFPRVSVERILCGEGLLNLYQSLAEVTGRQPVLHDPAAITQAATEGNDELARDTLTLFCRIFGEVAGDAALTVGALGGVYVCGGIIPRFAEFFLHSGFREAFERKGRLKGYMEGIPVFVVMEPYTGLLGAAEALGNDEV